MNIVVDENIAHSIVVRLREEGHQVKRIAEIARGSSDREVLEIAKRNNALLLTEDKDFGEIVIRYQSQATGVLLVRLEGFSPLERADMIAHAIQEHAAKLLNAFTVLSLNTLRIRFYA